MSALLDGQDPKTILEFLNYASTFPDFPKGFVPPSLLDPNYVPPTNFIRLEVFTYIMMVLMTATVAARLWARKRIKGMVFGLDDWLAIPGLVLSLGLMVIVILLIRIGGAGRHIYDISFTRIEKTQQLEFAGLMVYYSAIFVVRLSITAFLYRLMATTSTVKRNLLHLTVAVLTLQFLVQVFTYVFANKPISAGWDMRVRIAGYTHPNTTLEIFILSIIYLLTDVWLLILPIHTIWSLKLPIQTRIGVTWVFVFGGVACCGAILKACYIYDTLDTFDPVWHGVNFVAGAVIEVGFGVISSSMPALNHVIVVTLPKVLSFSGRLTGWLTTNSSNSKSFKEVYRSYNKGSDSDHGQAQLRDDSQDDEYHLDAPYLKKYDFKHEGPRYGGGVGRGADLESAPVGDVYSERF